MAQTLIGFLVHDAVARARGVTSRGEVALVHLNVRERHALFDENIPAGDHQNLPCRHPCEQKHGPAADGGDRRVVLCLVVRHHRRRKPALHRLHAHPREGRAIDPHGSSIERRAFRGSARNRSRSNRTHPPRRFRATRSDSPCRSEAAMGATTLFRPEGAEMADGRLPTSRR